MSEYCVLYCRVSTKDQEEKGLSLYAQEDLLRDYARDNNMTMVKMFKGNESAKKPGRKIFNAMLAYCRENEIVAILVENYDRLFRNKPDEVVIDEFVEKGGEIHRVGERIVQSADRDVEDQTLDEMKYVFARHERRKISKRVKYSIDQRLKKNEFPSQAPMGYVNIPRTTKSPARIELSDQASKVKKLLEIFSTGRYSPEQMVDVAHNLGLKSKRGNPLTADTVKYMLRNRFYYGEWEYDGKIYKNEGFYEPLIDKNLWLRNQEVLEKHTVRYSKSRGFPHRYKGLIFCAKCGRTLFAEYGKRKGYYSKKKKKEVEYKYLYYHCTRGFMTLANGRKERCDLLWFKEDEIDQEILQLIELLEFDEKLWEELKTQLFNIEGKEVMDYEIQTLRAEQTRIKNRLKKLADAYLDNVIDEKKFLKDYKGDAAKRMEEIEGRMAELEEDRHFWDENVGRLVAIIDGIKNFKEKFLEFDDEKRSQMLKLMAKKITANSDKQKINGKTYRPKQITIHWRGEFDTLFEAGVIKKLDEIGKQAPRWPRITMPNGGCKKNLLVNERKS